MSMPQSTEAITGGRAPDTTQTVQSVKATLQPASDYLAYIEKARSWNAYPLQPWRIAVLTHSNKMHAILERKELHFDLLDWFEDARASAVMRGDKVVSESDFWIHLYRQSISAIQQHFGNLSVHVVDVIPPGKSTVLFNELAKKQHEKPLPSPVANKQPKRPKQRNFKQRA